MCETSLIKFNHNNGVVRVLKVSDAIGDKMRTNRRNVTSKSCSRKDMRESIRYEIKEEGEAGSPCLRPLPLAKKLLICPLTDIAVWPPDTICIKR